MSIQCADLSISLLLVTARNYETFEATEAGGNRLSEANAYINFVRLH